VRRSHYRNAQRTLYRLLELGVLPIVNENDTVSFEEITVGDNDQLAAMMTEACDAGKLVLLSEADGLYDRDPREPGARRLEVIDFRDDFSRVEIAAKTSVGRGGMDTKLKAVRKLTPLGVDVILGTFLEERPVTRLLLKKGGTIFKGNPVRQKSRRKSWLSTVVKNDCFVVVDEGAARALVDSHTSLLPVGIRSVRGKFKRGEVIQVRHKSRVLAVGMTEYDHRELDRIKGKKSSEIGGLLEHVHSNVAIHKDNLFLKQDGP